MTAPDLMVLAAAFIVGLSKGGLSTLGALAVPILALRMDPLTAAALLLPVFIVSDLVGVWLFRHSFDRRNLAILIPAGLAGVIIATVLEPYLPAAFFLLATGLIGLTYCLRAWLLRAPPPRPADLWRGIFWGVMTGLTSFISHSGSPPYQTYVLPQKLPKMVFAGTTTLTFAAINWAKLPAYFALNLFDAVDLWLMTTLMAIAVLGAVIGNRLTRIMPEKAFVQVIQIALFALSLRLVWDGLHRLLAA